MNAPFMLRALRLANENRRLRYELATAREGWRRSSAGWLKAAYGWRDCAVEADGWKARAVLLYELAADQEYADEVLATQAAIESYPEAEA